MASRVGRGIALPFLDRGIRRRWGVSSTPQPHFTPGKDPVPIVQEAEWAPGPVWTAENLAPTGFDPRTVQPVVTLHEYLPKFKIAILFRMGNVSDKFVETIKTHILCSVLFFSPWKPCHLWENLEKYGRDGQATGDNIMRRMRFACWVAKAK
jgi:hypothetical protein